MRKQAFGSFGSSFFLDGTIKVSEHPYLLIYSYKTQKPIKRNYPIPRCYQACSYYALFLDQRTSSLFLLCFVSRSVYL